jgi:4-amino-4-deoxy-L-arabinose transferase-like glycosyltransferase
MSTSYRASPRPADQSGEAPANPIATLAREYGLTAMILIAILSHLINMFSYPLYLGDEGIYLEQAWAVVRLGQLAPYTYFYDHAPAGWIMLAFWEVLLPWHFFTLGMALNGARVLMLLFQVGSVVLLYRLVYLMTHSDFAAIATSLVFSLSPLDVYYQRMVLLDNEMVFWVLLALVLLVEPGRRLMTVLASGFCFGLAILCKENALFFAPVLAYLLYQRVRGTYRARFSLVGWTFCAFMLVSLYPLYAILKGEFVPAPSSIIGNGAPAAHVSLISTTLWQAGRHGGSILDPNSQFWQYFWGKWWNKDPVIIVVGACATAINFLIGLTDRQGRRETFVASLLAAAFTLYLIRGSIMIDFYVVPVLPFFALNVGLLLWRLAKVGPSGAIVATAVLLALTGAFLAQSHDEYFVDQTRLQVDQLKFIQQTIPSNAMILTDDDLWVDLHEPHGDSPIYPNAHSHWKIAADPAISDHLLHNNWQNLDYLIMSNQLHHIFELNNETMALTAYDHSHVLARFDEGDVELEVRQVEKGTASG